MREHVERYGVQFSNYGSEGRSGPTIGMALVTLAHYDYQDIEIFRIGSMAPMYSFLTANNEPVAIPKDHRSFYDIMRRLKSILKLDIDLSELRETGEAESNRLREILDRIAASSSAARDFIDKARAEFRYTPYVEPVELTPELNRALDDIIKNTPDQPRGSVTPVHAGSKLASFSLTPLGAARTIGLDMSTNYAIFKTGSKQYKVKTGDVIDVDKLSAEEGSWTELKDVLAVSRDGELIIGQPMVPEASVLAHVQSHDREKKIIVFKYKRKVRYRRKMGHRQHYTRLKISGIFIGDEEIDVREEPPAVEPAPSDELETEAPSDELAAEAVGEQPEVPTGHAEEVATDEEASDEPETSPAGELLETPSSKAGDAVAEGAATGQAEAKPRTTAKPRSSTRKSPAQKSPEAEANDNGP